MQELFDIYNQQYFDGKLPKYTVKIVSYIPGITVTGVPYGLCNRKRQVIYINITLKDDDRQNILIHEMAHAATTGKHNARWLAEMRRLQALGAPVDPGDLLQTSSRVTQAYVRGLAEEFFEDEEFHTRTFRQFLRLMVKDKGQTDSQAEFRRRYPWALRIFTEEKKKVQAEVKAITALQERLRATAATTH